MDQRAIMKIALQQSAYDCNCTADDFLAGQNRFFESTATDQARRYLELPHISNFVSYGTNIVVAGRAELLPEIERVLNGIPDIENCFETPGLYCLNRVLEKAGARICFMAEYFLPDWKEVYQYDRDCGYEMRVLEAPAFAEYYIPKWKNALCAKRKHLDRLAIGAFHEGKLVGLAGCSADCDTMWQIGVDVLPEYRRQGIASSLTNKLAREIFARGCVPFYCAAWSNVRSVKNAIRSGFRPGWIEVTAKSDRFIEEMLLRKDEQTSS